MAIDITTLICNGINGTNVLNECNQAIHYEFVPSARLIISQAIKVFIWDKARLVELLNQPQE